MKIKDLESDLTKTNSEHQILIEEYQDLAKKFQAQVKKSYVFQRSSQELTEMEQADLQALREQSLDYHRNWIKCQQKMEQQKHQLRSKQDIIRKLYDQQSRQKRMQAAHATVRENVKDRYGIIDVLKVPAARGLLFEYLGEKDFRSLLLTNKEVMALFQFKAWNKYLLQPMLHKARVAIKNERDRQSLKDISNPLA